jgi:hypothetical protein
MTRLQTLTFLMVYGYLSWAAPAQADAVVDWNATAVQVITTAVPGHPGATNFLDMAMVQAATEPLANACSVASQGDSALSGLHVRGKRCE